MHDIAVWKNIVIALTPVLLFYIIYARYSFFYPEISKQIQAVIAGVVAALLIILLKDAVLLILPYSSLWVKAFIKAALLEKGVVFVLILVVFRHYLNFSVLEGALTGILIGIGFSTCENIFYALSYGTNTMIIRILFTVPLHMTSCGILGYYLSESRYARTKIYKSYYLLKAIFYPILFHGLFDYILLHQNYYIYIASPFLLFVVIITEIKLSKARTVPGLSVLDALEISYEDWTLLNRQPKYDRWMQKSMGRKHTPKVNFFVWRPGIFQAVMIVGFMVLSVTGALFKADISKFFLLTRWEENLLMIIFPLSIAGTTMIVNAVNPEFFKYNELKIPIISNVVVESDDGFDDNYVTYDISPVNAFVNTFEPLGINEVIEMELEVPHLPARKVVGKVVWEKHVVGHSPAGSLIEFQDVTARFAFFIIFRYYVSRFVKGIVFNLHLPGFESIKGFFIHPVSAMRDEKIYKEGESIYLEGEESKKFFFLKKGIVEIYRQKDDEDGISLNVVTDGSIFGEMSVFGGKRRSNAARALTDCIIATSDRENLHILVKNNTEFAIQLFESLSIRIAETENSLFSYIKDLEAQKKENQRLYHSISMILISTLRSNEGVDQRLLTFKRLQKIINNINDEIATELVRVLTYDKEDKSEVVEKRLKKIYRSIIQIENKNKV